MKMNRKSLVNKLELAYAPLTSYEFALVKKDPIIERALEDADIYIIAQRPVITFENVYQDEEEYALHFEIHQRDNSAIIKGKIQLIQEAAGSKEEDTIGVSFNFLDKTKQQTTFPFQNVHGFSLVDYNENEGKFLLWFSPEKLLKNWWNGNIECEIDGDISSFLEYNVHYVGKATKQSILKRLTGHNTFQDILSLENPFTYKDLPKNEIVLLCFKFEDILQINVFDKESKSEDIVDSLLEKNFPKKETVSLDSEKALIRAMQPKYNKELFKNYPKSKDGLFKEKIGYLSYSFVDPITLIYDEGRIRGKQCFEGGDTIVVKNGKKIELRKAD